MMTAIIKRSETTETTPTIVAIRTSSERPSLLGIEVVGKGVLGDGDGEETASATWKPASWRRSRPGCAIIARLTSVAGMISSLSPELVLLVVKT